MEKTDSNIQLATKLVDTTKRDTTNSRKVPNIQFLDDVNDWVNKYTAENIIEILNQYLNKFKYMEAQVIRHLESVKTKIPDLEKALESISYLEKKPKGSSVQIDYMVSNNLWAKSEVNIGETVYLWLGADIMCEYSMSEAKEVLYSNLEKAKQNIKVDEKDLDFLKDQITICEVNIARVYNENVRRKQAAKKAQQAKSK